MTHSFRFLVILFALTIFNGCLSSVKRLCPDGSLKLIPSKCTLKLKYQSPSIVRGIFELPIIDNVKTPIVIQSELVSPEVLRHISEKVKNIEFRYKTTCEKLQAYGCETNYFALKNDLEQYQLALEALKSIFLDATTAENFKAKVIVWMSRYTTKRQYQARVESGDDLYIEKKYDKAIEEYQQALEYSDRPSLRYRLGLTYQEFARIDEKMVQNYWIEAFNSFAKCYELSESYNPCAYSIALMTIQKSQNEGGGFDTALETLTVLESREKDPVLKLYIQYFTGWVHIKKKNIEHAKIKYEELLKSKSKDLYIKVFSNFNLSLIYSAMSTSDEADEKRNRVNQSIALLEKSLKLAQKKGKNDLKSNLLSHFNDQKKEFTEPITADPRWATLEKSFHNLTHH